LAGESNKNVIEFYVNIDLNTVIYANQGLNAIK